MKKSLITYEHNSNRKYEFRKGQLLNITEAENINQRKELYPRYVDKHISDGTFYKNLNNIEKLENSIKLTEKSTWSSPLVPGHGKYGQN